MSLLKWYEGSLPLALVDQLQPKVEDEDKLVILELVVYHHDKHTQPDQWSMTTANVPESGRASPAGSDETEKTEVGTVVAGGRGGGAGGGGSSNGSQTTISSPTPRYAEPNVNVGLGINMNGARELRPTASAPPGPDRVDRSKLDWRQRQPLSAAIRSSAH